MKRLLLPLCLILCITTNIFSQSKETNIWYFGYNAGIDFNSGTAVPLTDGELETNEGCASLADTSGQLLFYTDGITVWDRYHQVMPNGTGLMGNSSSTQSAIITPQPGDPNIYYIFTVDAWENLLENGFRYSVVDMSLNGGAGDIIPGQKNIQLIDIVCEKVTAVKHGNNNSIWVIAHRFNSYDFHAYLISPLTGLDPNPVISSVGQYMGGSNRNARGYLRASADGKKIALAMNGSSASSSATNFIEIYDFDDMTGQLSNAVKIDGFSTSDSAYGVEFSPNSKYLYVSERSSNGNLYQFNVESSSPSLIYGSRYDFEDLNTNGYGAIQLAPDGNIYIARSLSGNIDRILEPDKKGAACEYDPMSFYLNGEISREGLPPFIQTYLLPDFIVDGGCLNDTTFFQMNLFAVDSVHWDFGDPNSGPLNFSTEMHPWHIYTQPGEYNVTLTAYLNGLVGTKTHDTKVNVVIADLGADTVTCQGQIIDLHPDVPFAEYLWQDGSTEEVFQATESGEYWVEIDYNGCIDRDSVILDVNPLPEIPLADTVLCDGQTLFVDATFPNASSYTWQDGTTNPQIVIDNPGIYEVDIEALGCTASSSLTVNFSPVPELNLGNDTTLCIGETMILDETQPNATYVWHDGSTNPTFEVTEPGNYSLAITESNCTWVDNINVEYSPLPTADFGNDTTLCENEEVTLVATNPNSTYTWQDGSTNNTLTVTQAGTYSVEINSENCIVTEEIQIDYQALPVVNLGNDQVLCDGEIATLNASVLGATYVWQDNSGNETFEVTEPGTYSVEVTLNNCVNTDEVIIDYNPLPTADFGNDTLLCENEVMTLVATNPNATYTWQDGSSNNTFTVSQPGNYSVEINMNDCIITEDIQIGYQALPIVNLGNDFVLCEGEIETLDASQINATYLWQDGSTNPTFDVNSPGDYSVEVTINGCSSDDQVAVDYNPLPIVSLGQGETLCEGETTTLNASQGTATYLWNDGTTQPTLFVDGPGTYSVELTIDGCSNVQEYEILYNPLPIVDLGTNTTICDGVPFTLDVEQPGGTYLWQNGWNQGQLIIDQAGTYSVQVTVDNCTSSDVIDISSITTPIIELGVDVALCEGETYSLDASYPDANFLWSDGSTTPEFTITEEGSYSVIASNVCGSVEDEMYAYYNAPPEPISIGNDTTICSYQPIILTASNENTLTYTWQDGSDNPYMVTHEPGLYQVAFSNECGTTYSNINIDFDKCSCDIYVPNAFSPDADGMNDGFRPYPECDLLAYNMKIYNRWGGQVFETSNINQMWDGRFQGSDVQIGVYVYVIEFQHDYGRGILKGDVTVTK